MEGKSKTATMTEPRKWECSNCGAPATVVQGKYPFVESGLENVYLVGIDLIKCSKCKNIDPIIPNSVFGRRGVTERITWASHSCLPTPFVLIDNNVWSPKRTPDLDPRSGPWSGVHWGVAAQQLVPLDPNPFNHRPA